MCVHRMTLFRQEIGMVLLLMQPVCRMTGVMPVVGGRDRNAVLNDFGCQQGVIEEKGAF